VEAPLVAELGFTTIIRDVREAERSRPPDMRSNLRQQIEILLDIIGTTENVNEPKVIQCRAHVEECLNQRVNYSGTVERGALIQPRAHTFICLKGDYITFCEGNGRHIQTSKTKAQYTSIDYENFMESPGAGVT
jgi:hypothetical protein